MYWSDYHLHTHFSADSQELMKNHIAVAEAKGIQEICFTDHFEYELPDWGPEWACDVDGIFAEIDALPSSPVRIKKGVEMGLRLGDDSVQKTVDALSSHDFDFVIASIHFIDGKDVYYPSFFEGKTKSEAFATYLENILGALQQTDYYSTVGHIDFPSKGCPLPNAALQYEDAPDLLDSLFRHVHEHGKMIEINTSILKVPAARPRDEKLWRRYVELGNETVTMGSDSHTAEFLGYQFEETRDFLQSVGVKYVATFDKMEPTFHALT